ncbi:hypothetical protein AAC387_Pa02g1329 [Persea americana]
MFVSVPDRHKLGGRRAPHPTLKDDVDPTWLRELSGQWCHRTPLRLRLLDNGSVTTSTCGCHVGCSARFRHTPATKGVESTWQMRDSAI